MKHRGAVQVLPGRVSTGARRTGYDIHTLAPIGALADTGYGSGAYGDGPDGGEPTAPTYEALTWPVPPAVADTADGDATYEMGILFTVSDAKDCVGIRWHVPSMDVAPGGAGHSVTLWDRITEVRRATITFTAVPGTDQDILFTTAYPLVVGVEYVASVFTNHYVYHAPTTGTVTSPSGNITGTSNRLSPGSDSLYPASNYNNWYYVSPLVST